MSVVSFALAVVLIMKANTSLNTDLKMSVACCWKWLDFWVRSHTYFLAPRSWYQVCIDSKLFRAPTHSFLHFLFQAIVHIVSWLCMLHLKPFFQHTQNAFIYFTGDSEKKHI